MSLPPPNERRLIPRWRSYRATLALGELTPRSARPNRSWTESLEQREQRARDFGPADKGPHAADLVGSALVLGPSEPALAAARGLTSGRIAGTPLARAVAQTVLERAEGPPTREPIDESTDELGADLDDLRARLADNPRNALQRRELGDLRARLVGNPSNAMRWADLARLYTILAQAEKAQQAMRVALALAAEDRYVLRSAARLAVHRREYDRAHAILASAPVTPTDPWLLASEIAIADLAGARSKFIRRAREMVTDPRYSDFEINEVASALATVELAGGDHRASRRLFRKALQAPTDNTLAQVAWARPHVGLNVDEGLFKTPGSWEARALAAHQHGDWRVSTEQSGRWQDDQPFASGPAEFGSYEASRGGDFELGAQFAERGLFTNPNEFLLLNNAAFCLLSSGEIDRARPHLEAMARLNLTASQRPTALATQGLYHYRTGDPDTGSARYSEAIATARDRYARALATLMLAREELRYGTGRAVQLLESARQAAKEVAPQELRLWIAQVEASLPTPHAVLPARPAPIPHTCPDPGEGVSKPR